MNDWTSGYRADIDYTHGYYDTLNPMRARLALLKAGLDCPAFSTACELGFGFGQSLNIHAAASKVQWWGNDFNPTQVAFAQKLADASGSGAKLFEQSFEEFCQRKDLPMFDFIGFHGIWSWVSQANRENLLELIRTKLKPGGVVMASYNMLSGWSGFLPIREMMVRHVERHGKPSDGIETNMRNAIDFAKAMMEVKPTYLAANPTVEQTVNELSKQDINYLAHEYFNRDWTPMHFGEIESQFAATKLEFACSARYTDHIPAMQLRNDQINFLTSIQDSVLRESARDLMQKQSFRMDYWVKGARRLSSAEQRDVLRGMRFVLNIHPQNIKYEFRNAHGTVNLKPEIYRPIVDALSDYKPHSGRELLGQEDNPQRWVQLLEALLLLCGLGCVNPVQSDSDIQASHDSAKRFNKHVLDRARFAEEVYGLASPVTGGAVSLDRVSQLMLLAHLDGQITPDQMASFVWKELREHGHAVSAGDKRLVTEQDHLPHLADLAQQFNTRVLPIIQSLQII